MLVETLIPDGYGPGDEFLVETEDGRQFQVVVPPDTLPGMSVTIELSDPPALLDVLVPSGLVAGDEFLVEHEGAQFSVIVPEGCGPGSLMQVDVPSGSAVPSLASSRKQSFVIEQPNASKEKGRAVEAVSAVTVEADRPKSKLTLSLALMGGLCLNLKLSAKPKFYVGDQVEVYRTDGYWSSATVCDFEEYGFTYTVELDDGRMKYMVVSPRFLWRHALCLFNAVKILPLACASVGGSFASHPRLFHATEWD
ncbi:MAG: hypothetical protein SGPRY_009313 [Prymnesium sp.]